MCGNPKGIMTVSHKENCVFALSENETIKQESVWASGNAQSAECTNICCEIAFISTLRDFSCFVNFSHSTHCKHHFSISSSSLDYAENWNIITFILVMVVWIRKLFFLRSFRFCLNQTEKINCGPMTFEFLVALFSRLHISTGHVYSIWGKRVVSVFERTGSWENDGCAKLFNEK